MHFTLTDLVTDIAQNGVESGASQVELFLSETGESLERSSIEPSSVERSSGAKREFRFTVKDNGRGMSSEEQLLARDPFVSDGIKHPNRKVGLGIPFLIQTAEISGGGFFVILLLGGTY